MYTKQFSSENLARIKRHEEENYNKIFVQLSDSSLKPEKREQL